MKKCYFRLKMDYESWDSYYVKKSLWAEAMIRNGYQPQ